METVAGRIRCEAWPVYHSSVGKAKLARAGLRQDVSMPIRSGNRPGVIGGPVVAEADGRSAHAYTDHRDEFQTAGFE
jgi:hypothetical protein